MPGMTRAAPINIGIGDKGSKKIADGLSGLLADTFSLYLRTHNFHWNVTGPMFNTLHLMFEAQYNALRLAVDSVASAFARSASLRRARSPISRNCRRCRKRRACWPPRR